jgi:hypothetical protein
MRGVRSRARNYRMQCAAADAEVDGTKTAKDGDRKRGGWCWWWGGERKSGALKSSSVRVCHEQGFCRFIALQLGMSFLESLGYAVERDLFASANQQMTKKGVCRIHGK